MRYFRLVRFTCVLTNFGVNVTKAVITAAGPEQEQIPMQTLIKRRGQPCSTRSVQLAELADSGIEVDVLLDRFALSREELKDPAQLDGWLREGSRSHVDSLCDWS